MGYLWITKASRIITIAQTGFQPKTIAKYFKRFRHQIELTLEEFDRIYLKTRKEKKLVGNIFTGIIFAFF